MFDLNSITSNIPNSIQEPSAEIEIETVDLKSHISACQQRKYQWSEFFELMENIASDDPFKLHFGLIGIRKLLNQSQSQYDQEQFQKGIDAGLITRLLEFMKKDDEKELQFQAAWALVGMTKEPFDRSREVVEHGALPILVSLFKSWDFPLVENVVWVIENLSVNRSGRDLLLDHEVLHPLIALVEEALHRKNNRLMKQGIWALKNFCQKPQPAFERISDAIPVFCRVIQEVPEIEAFQDAIWTLYYLSDKEEIKAKILEAENIVPSLIKFLDYSNNTTVVPTLRILGNITSGPDYQADKVLKVASTRNYIKKLFHILKQKSEKKWIRKEVCLSISSIVSRNSESVDLVMSNPDYTEQLVDTALYDAVEVQKQAVLVLQNATRNANKNQMISMTLKGVFDCMCRLVQQDLPDLFQPELIVIQTFLTFGASMSRKEATNNKYLIKMKQKGVVNQIKKLKGSKNPQVSELALEIWKRYCKANLLTKKLRLKRAIVCFRNERHALFGLFQNEKKRLCVVSTI